MDLIQYLAKEKIIPKKEAVRLKAQSKESKKTIEEILLESGLVKEKELFQEKSKLLNIPLREQAPEEMPEKMFSLLPRESADFYKMAPLAWQEKEKLFEVGMVYPENNQAQEALKFLGRQQRLSLKIHLIPFSLFNHLLAQYQTPASEAQKAIKGLEKEIGAAGGEEILALDKARFERLVEEAPIIKMVAVILRQAVEGNASDIHIEPARKHSRIRYRLDGILYPSLTLPLRSHQAIVARVKILSGLKIDETRIPQDGRFYTTMAEKRIDFRVSTFPTTLGEKVVLRVLDPEEGLKSLDELGLLGSSLEKMKEAVKKPYGMVLVTGPTGSGKSTTLYAVLKILNRPEVNIVTLEDPVEYFMEGVSQSQVRPEIKYTFARGLRQILRQDPDIIMVGEIRDEETANLAVHAALTGHLVLSTLHTNSAAGIVARLVDMNIRPFLIPATVLLAISQRLVRRLCPKCRRKVEAEGEAKKYILEKLKDLPPALKAKIKDPLFIYKPTGCKKCNDKGYAGRTGIFEAMPISEKLSRLITINPNEMEIIKQARQEGMISIIEDGVLKVLEGLTSLEEIMRVAEEK